MPRKTISINENIEYLSILNEQGELDEELEPTIDAKTLTRLYRAMLLGRRFDERMLNLQRQGRIGTFPPGKGQEAAQIGTVALLSKNDWLAPAFRETPAEIWRGRSMESVLLYYNGYNEGTIIDHDQRDLPMAVPVASQILHAVGLGMAAKYRHTDDIAMCYFGDGATSEGDFHEGLNCAAVFRAPVLFVCLNNQWAISIPVSEQTISKTIAQKALSYGMPGIQVDGNDILAVYSATEEAVKRARTGGGPTLIECVTYRLMMHTTADDPSRYRTNEEVEKWQARDPLPRFATYLQQKGVLDKGDFEALEQEVVAQIQTAIDNAEKQMKTLGDPLDMFDHLYAELPPYTTTQKVALSAELAKGDRGKSNG